STSTRALPGLSSIGFQSGSRTSRRCTSCWDSAPASTSRSTSSGAPAAFSARASARRCWSSSSAMRRSRTAALGSGSSPSKPWSPSAAATVGVAVALLALDVFYLGRRPHEPTMKEAGSALAFYIGFAVLFGLGVLVISGPDYGGQFYAGWLTEYSLSIDNLFVFLIIMTR